MAIRLFLAHTPLHILYSLSLIRAEPGPPPWLAMFNDFEGAGRTVDGLAGLLPAPGRAILLPGAQDAPRLPNPLRRLTAHLPLIAAVRRVRRLLAAHSLQAAYLFNDMRPDVQQIAAEARQGNPDCRLYAIEDGTAAYVDRQPPERTHARRLTALFPLVYGQSFERLESMGSFSRLQAAYLTFPEYASAALQRLPRYALPRPIFSPQELEALIGLFAPPEGSLFDWQGLSRAALICVPHSSGLTAALLANLRSLIRVWREQGWEVLLKAHPREQEDPARLLVAGERIRVLARTIPAELIVARLGSALCAVASGPSSVLHTTRWLNPAAEVWLISAEDAPPPPELARFLAAIGVWTPGSEDSRR